MTGGTWREFNSEITNGPARRGEGRPLRSSGKHRRFAEVIKHSRVAQGGKNDEAAAHSQEMAPGASISSFPVMNFNFIFISPLCSFSGA